MSEPPVHVAVVDDEEIVRNALGRLLRCLGFEVTAHVSGVAFLDALPARTPDCLLLDVNMPTLDGFGVIAELRRRDVPLPIVLMTGYDTPEIRERATSVHAGAYLRKPVDADDLVASIERAIGAPGPSVEP